MKMESDEFVAFIQASVGHYTPVIASKNDTGSHSFRELTKLELNKIPDAGEGRTTGYLHKKGINHHKWSKRYMLLRGPFLFYFLEPSETKPNGVMPLEGCEICLPQDESQTFSKTNKDKNARNGWQFEIRHSDRRTFQLFADSEVERREWVQSLSLRTMTGQETTRPSMSSPGIAPPSSQQQQQPRSRTGPQLPVSLPTSTNQGQGANNILAAAAASVFSPSSSSTGQRLFGAASNNNAIPPPSTLPPPPSLPPSMPPLPSFPPPSSSSMHGHQAGFGLELPSSMQWQAAQQIHPSIRASIVMPDDFDDDEEISRKARQNVMTAFDEDDEDYSIPPPELQKESYYDSSSRIPDSAMQSTAEKEMQIRKQAALEMMMLEHELQERLRIEEEARRREAEARERGRSRERIEIGRQREQENPMTLTQLFRVQLLSIGRRIVEPPQPDAPQQVPHLNGDWAEKMLVAVYRKYSRMEGFMSIEEFVEFTEDCSILQTHVPHDDNDEPYEEFQAQIDPVRLITTIPRNLGSAEEDVPKEALYDDFHINFTQFFHLLLRMSKIVYKDLFERDCTEAMHKLLQEVVLPLYTWSQGHDKRGATDPLVVEGRILLLMQTYAPNLWRVFLFYAQDGQNRIPNLSLPYPEAAQASEMALSGLPTSLPPPSGLQENQAAVGYFMTKQSICRFTDDYGITPTIISKSRVAEIAGELQRRGLTMLESRNFAVPYNTKTGVSMVDNAARMTKTSATVARERELTVIKKNIQYNHANSGAFYVGRSGESNARSMADIPVAIQESSRVTKSGHMQLQMNKTGSVSARLMGNRPDSAASTATSVVPEAGVGFAEFIELLSRVAVEGMMKKSFHVLFSSAFSKVLALLTMWGVADLTRLEEVKFIRTDAHVNSTR